MMENCTRLQWIATVVLAWALMQMVGWGIGLLQEWIEDEED